MLLICIYQTDFNLINENFKGLNISHCRRYFEMLCYSAQGVGKVKCPIFSFEESNKLVLIIIISKLHKLI